MSGIPVGRMGSEISDDTVEPLAYAVCNTDGVEGLSWAEVEECEVSRNKSIDLELQYWALLKIKSSDMKDSPCFFLKCLKTEILTPFWKEKKMWALKDMYLCFSAKGWIRSDVK